jgi:hypothetical protein
VPSNGRIHKPGELFPRSGSLTDELLEQWLTKGVIAKRPNKNGVTSSGLYNKLATHTPSGVSVDLFATTRERWFVIAGGAHWLGRDEHTWLPATYGAAFSSTLMA